MKFIGWNCQGMGRNIGSSHKMEHLSRLMNSTGAQISVISETRSFRCNSSQINPCFNTAGSFVVPSNGLLGGLWLLWSDEVQISIKFSNNYVILAVVVHIATNTEFALACVYGDPHHHLTKMIWDHVSTFVFNNLGKPVVFLGDLNEIMHDVVPMLISCY
uniref:Uncharacterized protein n=1 Tax=Avena sativa TaxID=4498 RepID=A0ACD6AED0_AVESA